MTTLNIDLETYSGTDLRVCGLHRYIEDPCFEVLLFGYAFDDEPVEVLEIPTFDERDRWEQDPIDCLPERIIHAFEDPNIELSAFNARFERNCINKFFSTTSYRVNIPASRYHCTMIHSLMLGLPATLDGVAKALRLNAQKDASGKALIRYFSMPCKPTKANGGRTRNMPGDAPEKWAIFKSYCGQDVKVERTIKGKLVKFPIPESEHRLWSLDQKIDAIGVQIDTVLVQNAIKANEEYHERLIDEAVSITGLHNPNSVKQLKVWIGNAEDIEVKSLTKKTVPVLLESVESEKVKRVLEIRTELAKTSIKKYSAMNRAVCRDGRVRGLLQFYGANRTGRWSGRIVQVQNLPKNHLKDLELARDLVRTGRHEDIELLYSSLPDILSQLIRTALVARPGHRFIVADFSAIEARVIAWLAGEKWRLDVFKTHGKIYEASAAQMFHLSIDEVDKELRQKGKVAELALGYQGGPNALITMGALDKGLKEDELPGIVERWRLASPKIVRLWKDLDNAAKKAIKDRTPVKLQYGVTFTYRSGILFLRLPSGRELAYVRPKLEHEDAFNRMVVSYEGYEDGRWGRRRGYGGLWAENTVQAIARDCLAEAMLRLDEAGYDIVFHVHDECVIEAEEGFGSLDDAIEIMRQPIPWAPGLPLNAAGFEGAFYKKD